MKKPSNNVPLTCEPTSLPANQTAAPVPVQNWQQPPSAYESTYQAPMGDIVIPLDETTSGGRNWLGVIIIVVTAVALISTVAFSVYYFGNKSGYKKGVNDTRKEQARKLANEATSSDQSSNEDDEASLDFSLVQPEYKDESIDGEIAEQIQSSDGLVVYVKGVDHDFQPTSSTHQGASGTELIKVNILVGNASQTQPLALKGDSFLIELPDGKTVSPVADIGTYEGQVGSLTLTSGNKARLAVVFEVEKGVKSIKLLRQQSYVLKASGQTVIMQMRIALD
jgi:hypothetical protein